MSISVDGKTLWLKADAKGQYTKIKTVRQPKPWMMFRRNVEESLEDMQVRVQQIVDALEVRSRARVMLMRPFARLAIAPRVAQRSPAHTQAWLTVCVVACRLSDGNVVCTRCRLARVRLRCGPTHALFHIHANRRLTRVQTTEEGAAQEESQVLAVQHG